MKKRHLQKYFGFLLPPYFNFLSWKKVSKELLCKTSFCCRMLYLSSCFSGTTTEHHRLKICFVPYAENKVFGQAFFKKLVRVWEQSSQGLLHLEACFWKGLGKLFTSKKSFPKNFLSWKKVSKELLCKTSVLLLYVGVE